MLPIEFAGIIPELIIALGGLLILAVPRGWSVRLLGRMTLVFLAAAADLKLLWFFKGPLHQPLFYGMLIQDRFSLFFQWAILLAVGFVVLVLMGYNREEVRGRREVYALLLLTTVGLMLVVGAQHFALLYVGLEMISLFSYLLVGIQKREVLSIEGGLKYFLFGSLATGTMLYGISLVYGLTGILNLPYLSGAYLKVMASAPFLGTVALILLVVGIGFKVALVPFHMWAPDAYEGAAAPVTAFLSLAPKIAGFGVLARVFLFGFSSEILLWPSLLAILAALTMTIGNIAALVQTNVKRLLAYSSIAHAGTMAIGLAMASPIGFTATLYYLCAYLLMNAGAFAGLIAVGNSAGREDLAAFNGLSRTEPFLALTITVMLLSLAGIPPTAGFFAKMWIFAAALKGGAAWLAILAAANSVISLFYYAKIVKAMYLDPAANQKPVLHSRLLRLALGLCAVGLFVVGLWPGFWLALSASSGPGSFMKPADLPFGK